MKLALQGPVLVFGGCYSNLQAAEALLAQAARRGIPPGNMICTGDIVAYGADAAATLRLVRNAGIVAIRGNCEASLSAKAADCGCGFAPGSECDALAAHWYAHAAAQMDDGDRHYMARLPKQIVLQLGAKKLLVVHGNVERINAFVFPSASNLELARQIELSGCDGVIAGHSGIPFTRRLDDKTWHNTGAIGLPANDGTQRGWFSILQEKSGEIEITSHELNYDFACAAQAMRRAGLPEGYAVALETGLWPSLDILPAAEKLRTGMALETSPARAAPPVISLARLETLWVNTGTLCNLACTQCFMASSPTNDSLSYFSLDSFRAVLAMTPPELTEIGFTGGEPFMNPDILQMLELALMAGKSVLLLTNAMRPMQRLAEPLAALIAAYPGKVAVRVSLDHFDPPRHDELRGAGSFVPSLAGLKFLGQTEASLSVACRTPWGETEAMLRGGFARLFAEYGIALDPEDPSQLVLFPEMDAGSPSETVTEAALAAVPPEKPLMCATSRMVVQRTGAKSWNFTPCTLLPEADLGVNFQRAVALDHPHCAQFCVFGGASCAGAPG